jgi:hypothetical protein
MVLMFMAPSLYAQACSASQSALPAAKRSVDETLRVDRRTAAALVQPWRDRPAYRRRCGGGSLRHASYRPDLTRCPYRKTRPRRISQRDRLG